MVNISQSVTNRTMAFEGDFRTVSYLSDTLNTSQRIDEAESDDTDEPFLPWKNPWNLISFETARDIMTGVGFFIYPPIFVIGVSTNLLNCLVFWRQGLRDRMNLCLFWLAVVDLGYLFTSAASVARGFITLVDPVFALEFEAYVITYVSGASFSFLSTSGCITVVIAVERCLCVAFPLKAANIMSTKTMAILLLLITFLLQLGYTIWPVRMAPIKVPDPRTGEVVWIFTPVERPNNEVVIFVHKWIYDVLLQFLLPIVTASVVVVCTIITVFKLRLAMKWRQATSSSASSSDKQSQQASLTKMLVLISCVYIVCSIPGCVLALWRQSDPHFSASGRYSNMFYAAHMIGFNVFAVSHSSVNFFVYFWRSSKYRTVLRTFCCGREVSAEKKSSEITQSTQCQ